VCVREVKIARYDGLTAALTKFLSSGKLGRVTREFVKQLRGLLGLLEV
jgi:hypothetical protein